MANVRRFFFFTGCPCRKSDPVGNGQRIGRSCVGCASCLGCPSAWSLTCFGHEQRGKLRSWCLDSRLFCCIAPGTMASALRVFGYRWQTQPKTTLSAISKARLPIVLALEVPTPSGPSRAVVRRVGGLAGINQVRTRAISAPSPSCIATARRGPIHARSVGPLLQKEHNVPKEELLEFEGLVTEILPDARYRVQLDNGHQLVAYTAGRMKKNRIKTLAGDRVTVEVSTYDLEKGRLIFRHKDERAGSLSRPPRRHQFRRR